MNRPILHALVATFLLCALVLTGCGGGGGSTTTPPNNPTITSVTVSCANQSVMVSGSVQCTATVQGTGNFSHAVTWSASQGSISTSGVYTAPLTAPSQAVTITARSSADTTKSGTATVTVTATPATITSVAPTCVKSSAWTGDTVQCSATVQGTGDYSSLVTWSVDKGSITSTGGLFTASVVGTATITATAVGDNTKKGTIQIVVSQSTVTSVSVSCDTTSVAVNGTDQCHATVNGNGNTGGVTWTASAGSISTSGLFTAPATVPAQAVVITAHSTVDPTKTGTANITVTAAPPTITGVTLTCPESSLPQGLVEQCTATVQGTGSYNQNVNWSASGGTISGGMFTAPATSVSVTITATAAGDSTKFATKAVTVTTPQKAAFDYKGVTHVSWGADEYNTTAGTASQDAIATTNFNWAGVLVTQYMQTATSNTIAPVSWTPSDAAVVAAITELRAKGVKVMLKPHVDVQDNTWRGSIAPSDVDAWFANFTTFITHYAQIAEANHVEMLCFGTEYKSMTSGNATQWSNVITAIKAVYSGKLAYAANASSTNDEFKTVVFWDQVDVIGLDGYFSLTNHADPTISELIAAWSNNKNGENIVSAVTTFANAHSTKPVIFTEIGYRSAAGANIAPWDWQVSAGADNIEQQNCYEAMFRVWAIQTGLPIKGYFLWAWPVPPPAAGDTDYNPRDKPAQKVLFNWQ